MSRDCLNDGKADKLYSDRALPQQTKGMIMLIRINELEDSSRRNFLARNAGLLLSGAAVAMLAGGLIGGRMLQLDKPDEYGPSS